MEHPMVVVKKRFILGGRNLLIRLAGLAAVSLLFYGAPRLPETNLMAATPNAPRNTPVRTPRQVVLEAMQARPGDPWPRGEGHVILGFPGSRETAKAYHEPGGSFSPAVGSFGVSLWVPTPEGKIQATSDSLPLNDLKQQFFWTNTSVLPSITTTTAYYHATWSSAGAGAWQLLLVNKTNAAMRSSLAIRSVGPAGGPIQTLDWNGTRLLINNRWMLSLTPPPASFFIGQEGSPGWINAVSTNTVWRSPDGWGFARFDLPGPAPRRILIRDTLRATGSELAYRTMLPGVSLMLPEPEFQTCLNAQTAHLMMGLTGLESRPGDPMALPASSTRVAAKVAVALAQAGQIEVARQLSRILAERDFLGPYGPEADGPGMALWALDEIGSRLHEAAYDSSITPHVYRKVELIYEMLMSQRQLRKPVIGPVFPQLARTPLLTAVADSTSNGIIQGKIEQDWEPLYVTAISYRGLLSAARLAERVSDPVSAELWRVQAADLQQAYIRAFRPPASDQDWAYLNGLWPSGIATPLLMIYTNNLQSRWVMAHDDKGNLRQSPLHCSFALAETHQWLYSNHAERAWNTVSWMLRNQASPGLYTWWDGIRGGNVFPNWEQVRGWVNPRRVTPHYGAAAEMTMLQLDMLACVDESSPEPVLILGAGIPPAWLRQTLSARGLSTRLGGVDWVWQNQQMNVTIRGRRPLVRLGTVFGPNPRIIVR